MSGDRVGLGIGLFFVAAGVLFLLEGLDVLRVRAAYLWPLLLIGLGVALLLGGIRREEPERAAASPPEEAPREGRPAPAEKRAETEEERPGDDRSGEDRPTA